MKRSYLLLFAAIFIFFLCLFINTKFLSMDEIWCYGFTHRIAVGYIPYKDFNIVVTPLFFYIGILFSKSLLCFRIYGALIDAAVVLVTYYFFNRYQIDKSSTALFSMLNCALISIIGVANYNTLLLLGLMGTYLIAEKFLIEMNESNSFLLGISFSIALFIKQNVPAILIIVFTLVLALMLLIRSISVRIFLMYFIGGFLPVACFLVISLFSGSSLEFIDYTVKGMQFFVINQNFQGLAIILVLLSNVITVLIGITMLKEKINNLKSWLPLIFSMSSYMLIYPLNDGYHSILLLVFNIFLSATLVGKLPVKFIFRLHLTLISLILVFGYYSFSIMSGDSKMDYIRSDIEYYQNIYINTKLEHNIALVSDFIKENEKKGYDVAIVGSNAYLYNIPAKDFNGILDLLLIGNIGTTSANEIKALIDKKDIILMGDAIGKYDIKEIRDYISDEYVLHGIIGNMNIYRKYKTAY